MKNSHFLSAAFSLLALIFFSGESKADACPQGMITNPVGAGGQPQCIPGANHQNWGGGKSSGEAHWATRWGAIAGDQKSGKTGVAGGMPNKRKASKDAIAQCQSKGGVDCKVLITFYNQCGVLAWGGGGMTTASAPTLEEASDIAVSNCSKGSSEKCKVYFSDCSYAELVQ